MRHTTVLTAIAALTILALTGFCRAAVTDLYVIDGQSNATWSFAAGISDTLAASGRPNQYQVVSLTHPGAWLLTWWADTPQGFYRSDFYDPDVNAQGTLEAAEAAIMAAGNTYRVADLFWFQGEGDSEEQRQVDLYKQRFTAMLSDISQNLNHGEPVPFTVALIGGDQSQLDQARWDRVLQMREVLRDLGTSPISSYVDSQPFERRDLWHLTDPAAYTFGQAMAQTYLASIPEPASGLALFGGTFLLLRRRQTFS